MLTTVLDRHHNAYCNPSVLMRMARSGSPDAMDRITRCYGERLLVNVRGFPTFLLFRRGREHDRLSGFPGPARMRAWLERAEPGLAIRGLD